MARLKHAVMRRDTVDNRVILKDPNNVTSPLPISRFPVPDLANMPEDIRNRILAVQEKSGFISNVFLVLAHRPDEFRAFFAYHDALMDKAGNLTKAEREMIVDRPRHRRSRSCSNTRCGCRGRRGRPSRILDARSVRRRVHVPAGASCP